MTNRVSRSLPSTATEAQSNTKLGLFVLVVLKTGPI
jgi:hypothetical protein